MVNKVGIVVKNLYNNQLSYTILKQSYPNYDISIFYEDVTPILMTPKGGIFSANEMFNYNGILIATSLDTANSVSKVLKTSNKLFYVWDLEWLRNKKDYLYNITIYTNPNLKLITPSDDYRKELLNYSNRDSYVLPLDFKVINEKFRNS